MEMHVTQTHTHKYPLSTTSLIWWSRCPHRPAGLDDWGIQMKIKIIRFNPWGVQCHEVETVSK